MTRLRLARGVPRPVRRFDRYATCGGRSTSNNAAARTPLQNKVQPLQNFAGKTSLNPVQSTVLAPLGGASRRGEQSRGRDHALAATLIGAFRQKAQC